MKGKVRLEITAFFYCLILGGILTYKIKRPLMQSIESIAKVN